jgi:hypothetical protein
MTDFRSYCVSLGIIYGSIDKDSEKFKTLIDAYNSGFETEDRKISRPIEGTVKPPMRSEGAASTPKGAKVRHAGAVSDLEAGKRAGEKTSSLVQLLGGNKVTGRDGESDIFMAENLPPKTTDDAGGSPAPAPPSGIAKPFSMPVSYEGGSILRTEYRRLCSCGSEFVTGRNSSASGCMPCTKRYRAAYGHDWWVRKGVRKKGCPGKGGRL